MGHVVHCIIPYGACGASELDIRELTQPVQELTTGTCFLGMGFSSHLGRAYLVGDTPFQASVWSHVACSHRAYVHMWSTFPLSHECPH